MFRTVGRILHWCKDYKARIFWGCVCSFFETWFAAFPTMLAAYMLGMVIDDARGLTTFDTNYIWISLLAIIGFIICRWLLAYGRNRLQESIGCELAAKQRIAMGDMLKRVSLGYFSKNNIGNIVATMTNEFSTLELQSMKMVDRVINGYVNMLAIILALFVISWQAALVALGGVVLSFLFLLLISRRSSKTAPVRIKAVEDMADSSIEYVRGLPIVKSFGKEGAAIANFQKACKDLKDININIELGFTPLNCMHLLMLKIASVGLVAVSALLCLVDMISLPYMLMLCMFAFTIFAGVENINDAAHVLSIVDTALNHLDDIEQSGAIDENGKPVTLTNYEIKFNNVTFGYDSRKIFENVSLCIPENTTTAIVGPSGGGKTTLCNLIARFYDVQGGSITIGGHNVKEFTCDSLLKNISMVFQNVYLFNDTVRNNIRFGKSDATDEEVIDAAKKACCYDFIMALPNGFDTVIGEGGSSLSGGEKQRISIARAILKDAPIIILDEATASIDPENEHLIQHAIEELTHGKTIITIAHRLATIENADQILVVANGGIAERGTHKELIAHEGIYKKFMTIRETAEGWRL